MTDRKNIYIIIGSVVWFDILELNTVDHKHIFLLWSIKRFTNVKAIPKSNYEVIQMHNKRIAYSVILIILALFSILIAHPIFSTPNGYYKKYISSIDEQKKTATSLSATAAATSALITSLPDDWATPVAEQMAEVSKAFLIVLAVLYTEKYMMPMLGSFSTGLIIPIALIVLAISNKKKEKNHWKIYARRILILAITSIFIIPFGIYVSNSIESTFDNSIQNVYNESIQTEQEFSKAGEEDKNFFQKIGDSISDFFTGIFNGATELFDNAKNAVSRAIEAFAITLVINCIVPILVLIGYVLVIKRVFNMDFSVEDGMKKAYQKVFPNPWHIKKGHRKSHSNEQDLI